VITIGQVERGVACRRVSSIIVCEFGKGKQGGPIELLIVDVGAEVVLKSLVRSVCPSVWGW
jgi:hypothetical protein